MYDIDYIRKKLASFGNEEKPKNIKYWKPNNATIRFLPFPDETENKQPFYEIMFYSIPEMSERDIVAPYQFGLKDPIMEYRESIREKAWGPNADERHRNLFRILSPKTRYFSAIVERGKESEGVFIWSFGQTVCKSIYNILISDDFVNETVTDPYRGFDFNVSIFITEKMFKGKNVKEISILPRMKSTPLHSSKVEVERLLGLVPNIKEYFKSLVESYDDLKQKLEAYLNIDVGLNRIDDSSVISYGSNEDENLANKVGNELLEKLGKI